MIVRQMLVAMLLIPALGGVGMMPLGTQTVPGTLSIHATIESIGIVAPYTGDDDQDNATVAWYRPVGTSIWLVGHELFVDRSAREWRGSLVYLSPDTEYEIQVRFTDPDGVTPSTVSGSAHTRPDYPDVGDGGNILHVPDDGDLQTVIDAAAPGDTIRLRAGVYHTTAVLGVEDSGSPGNYLTIEAEPGDYVVLDGSDAQINDPTTNNWHYYQNNIYYTDLAWGGTTCNSFAAMTYYVGEQREGDSVRYLLYDEGASEWDDFLAGPPGKAFYDCDGSYPQRLYIVTCDNDDPDNHEMHVSQHQIGLLLDGADHVRIRNLEIRYYGKYGIHLASPGADHNIIEGNTFHGSKYHIFVGGWGDPSSADNLIQDNDFYERGYRDSGWTWREQYDSARSVGIRLAYAESGNVIRRNTFVGIHDGIVVGWQSPNTDVYENVVEESMDDGIEVDDQPGYNIRVWRNTVRHCYSSISNQDWFLGDHWNTGPIYIFRNVIDGGSDPQGRTDRFGGITGYFSNYAFKVGTDEDWIGRVYYYHNTISIPDSPEGGNGIQDAGGTRFSGIVSRNNIWSVRGRGFYLHYSTTTSGHDLDYDNLHNAGTPVDTRFILWSNGGPEGNGIYRNLVDFQAYTGQELHGISNNNTSFNPDFSLQDNSPDIDAGCVIVGFNDRGPWAYSGKKPDMGAFEYASEPDLTDSVKAASASSVSTGERVTFTIQIVNTGAPLTSTVVMTDVLPVGLDYLSGTLTATLGTAWLTQTNGTLPITTIYWQGIMNDTATVEIRYAVTVTVSDTVVLQNTAWINSNSTEEISRTRIIIVNGWNFYLPIIFKTWP